MNLLNCFDFEKMYSMLSFPLGIFQSKYFNALTQINILFVFKFKGCIEGCSGEYKAVNAIYFLANSIHDPYTFKIALKQQKINKL